MTEQNKALMDRVSRQIQVVDWVKKCFGDEAMTTTERANRFFEEAVELYQSCDMPKEDAIKLVDYVYGRKKGDPNQEIGGVGLTLLVLSEALLLYADVEERRELEGVLSKHPSYFQKRQNSKADQGVGMRAKEVCVECREVDDHKMSCGTSAGGSVRERAARKKKGE